MFKKRKGARLLKTLSPYDRILCYVMTRRSDAQVFFMDNADCAPMDEFIAKIEEEKGIRLSYLDIVNAAIVRVYAQKPALNRFVMNRKIYSRNHFCVSFVTLQPGKTSDTVTKLYFNLDDDIFTVNQKVQEAIEKTQVPDSQNALDKLMASLVRVPVLLGTAVGILKFIDKYFTLPFSIINASPFHTSLFVTNLASIRTDTIHHHLYEFGTTGIFISMGQPKKKVILNGENVEEHKVMELGIVTDERIANGHYYGRCFRELNKYYKNPELLETRPESVVRDPDIRVKNPKFIVK